MAAATDSSPHRARGCGTVTRATTNWPASCLAADAQPRSGASHGVPDGVDDLLGQRLSGMHAQDELDSSACAEHRRSDSSDKRLGQISRTDAVRLMAVASAAAMAG